MNCKDKITINCEDLHRHIDVTYGTSLKELSEELPILSNGPILAAYVNNRLKELHYKIYRPATIRFVDISSHAGYRLYQRTACFILQKACQELWQGHQLHIKHSLGYSGLYCEIEGKEALSNTEIEALLRQMRSIIEADYPIHRLRLPTSEVRERFSEMGYRDKIELLDTRPRLYSTLYTMESAIGYFYGSLAPSTGYIKQFDIRPYHNGFYLALPLSSNPDKMYLDPGSEKLFDVFSEYKYWNSILGMSTVGQINANILEGRVSDMIRISEAVHERCLARFADQIFHAHNTRGLKIIFISGPSSSGKTTTAKRLGIQLQVLGLKPTLISLDDYFVNRDQTPRDESGDYDYEALEAIDVALFNQHLGELLEGREVTIPRYNFITGQREWHSTPLRLEERSVVIIEGIHGLNPKLTPSIADDAKFKIYVSCLTSTSMDNLSRIATSDNRLLRRMIRDYRHRGSDAVSTLARWASVRRGEERHIFPYQECADVIFNSSLSYELSIIKPIAEPILREVPDTVPEYDEARRLLQFLDNFTPNYDLSNIPPTSILREFVGGSTFEY